MKTRILYPLLVVLLSSAGIAEAHHSFAGQYDINKIMTVDGDVTDVTFRNPHVQLFVDIDVDGKTENWAVALQNVAALRRVGIDRGTFQVGDRVRVVGNPGTNDKKKIYVITIEEDANSYAMFRDGTPARVAAPDAVVAATSTESSMAGALTGSWAFDIDKRLPGAPLHLSFQEPGGGVYVLFDNERIDVGFTDREFVIVLDRENGAGHPVQLQLVGTVEGNRLSGSVEMIKGQTRLQNLDAKTFTAARSNAARWDHNAPADMHPVDLSGIWRRTIGVGPLGRTNPQLNAAGKERYAEFQRGHYDPALRCLSTGPMRKYASPGAVEFLPSVNRLTILYAAGHDTRRVYFDRERHNPDREPDVMGESLAHWDGDVLVIDTRSLLPTVITHNAEPTSPNARIVERYWLEEDGHLTMEATLHDPDYLERPVVRRTQWVRTDNQQQDITYNECDPDSFYRTMFHDEVLQDYFEQQPKPLELDQ